MKQSLAKHLIAAAFYPLVFLAIIWLAFALQITYRFSPSLLGVRPRDPQGLHGIVTSVLVHGDLDHILSNSLPLLILGMMLFYFYRKIAFSAFLWIWLISGLWLWIGGRNSTEHPVYHIGASTLIYGLATFLFFSGVFRRHIPLMVVSALVVFLYGSIMWGVFPFKAEMSWEGHLFGAIAGVLVAFNYRKEGPQRKVYEWENESDDDTGEGGETLNADEDAVQGPGTDIRVNYILKPDPFRNKNSDK